jgi:DtxR family transcriptional regulator, Mn-dependent transcriptional regulator
MSTQFSLTGSLEDYLETIYHLLRVGNQARVKDVADQLNVKKSSVTVALRALAKQKLINYAPYGEITLTSHGEKAAEDVVRRHETLKDFLVTVLAVADIQAEDTACKMEHVLPKDVTDKLIRFMEFIDICPRNGKDWVEKYHASCGDKQTERDCSQCLDKTREKMKLLCSDGVENKRKHLLSELKPGQKAEIIKIQHKGDFRKRILEMGVTTGAVLTVERVAPLGDPVDIKIRGYHLSLRKEETKNILVKLL